MSAQIGRISGALLKDNLLRDGIDLAFETDLLYLDVNNQRIGIKSSSPTRDLFIDNSVKTTNLIVDNLATIDSMITIDNTSRIATFFNDLYISPAGPTPQTVSTHLQVGDFDIDGTTITVTASNADLEIRPTGSGITKVTSSLLWIDGSLHATGNVTLDGNLVFGSDDYDDVTFLADVDSDITPNLTEAYTLGRYDRRWANLWSGFLNGEVIDTATLEVGPIDPSTRQGNIWYVAVNGSSENVGDHPNGPFESIERAIAHASYGDTIYVYPGTYYELLPLTVPAGVTVTGTDIRNTIIVPDTASEFEDVFLLNDSSTVQNLTIKNFYFDSMNNKGYAFKFAPNMQVVSRSPYVQNISVITKGTVTSISDPLGFGSSDAGKGAYIDGSVVNSGSNQATLLFHSATFITPGVDCITMLNGVRVEWLNCFTYYANRGLYAQQGVSGFANLGLVFGAEVRSIGSANIYGNYGAEADGANTLMYLINHNFAYIGTGKDASNDPTLVIQENEIIELNSGQIHYTSFDHAGTFRVGDIFWIDLKKGTTSFNLSSISTSNLAGIKLIDGSQITYIDFSKIETGNLQISGNTILSITGSVNIASASNDINLDQDIFVSKNLNISNDFTIHGALTFGNQTTDTIIFDADIDDNLDPKANITYNIGSPSRNWKDLYTRRAEISDIEIFTNYIRTLYSNEDLELRTSGTGTILLEDIRVQQRNISTDSTNIKIESATTLDITNLTTNINGSLHVTNDTYFDNNTIFGNNVLDTVNFKSFINSSIEPSIDNFYVLGDSDRSWNLYTASILLDDIEINDNYIRTTASNLNLELKASGTGSIQAEKTYFNENLIYTVGTNLKIEPATTLDITGNTLFDSNFHITGIIQFNTDIVLGTDSTDLVKFNSSINSSIIPEISSTYELGNSQKTWNLYTGKILLDEIEINDNYIQTTVSNLNLELKAGGVGSIKAEQTYFNENLIYTVGTNLKIEPATTLDITASTTNINGIFHVTGNVSFDSNLIIGNSNTDLIRIPSRVSSDFIPYVDSTYNLGNTTRSWNLYTDKILLDDIEINDNYIQGLISNLNLEFKANGTGAVRVEQVDFNENVIKTNGTTKLELRPATTLDIFATTNVNGSVAITGNFDWQGTITFGNATTDDVVFIADINSDLIPDLDITYNIGSLAKRWKTLYSRNAIISDIEINTNYITTTNGNKDLDLRGNSAGGVRLEDLIFRSNTVESGVTNQNIQVNLTGTSILDINTNTSLRLPRGTIANRPIIDMLSGEIKFNTTDNLFGGFATTRTTFGGVYSENRLTYARAEPTSNIITFINNGTNSAYVDPTKFWVTGLLVDALSFQNNTITTLLGGGAGTGPTALTRDGDTLIFRDGAELIGSSTPFGIDPDLVLDPDLNNTVDIDNFRFDDNEINNLSNNALTFSTTGTGYIKFDSTLGIVIPAGMDAERSLTPAQGTTRWSTEQDWLEIYIGTQWQLATATSGSAFASPAEIKEAADIWTLILG